VKSVVSKGSGGPTAPLAVPKVIMMY
jgi:hypothetical protein